MKEKREEKKNNKNCRVIEMTSSKRILKDEINRIIKEEIKKKNPKKKERKTQKDNTISTEKVRKIASGFCLRARKDMEG